MKTILREIEVKLSKEEIIKKATDLANYHAEVGEIEKDLKDYSKERKAEVNKRKTSINQICKCIEDGTELRQLECSIEKDFDHNTIRYVHQGQIVEERAMTAQERQEELFNTDSATESSDDPITDLAEEVFDEQFPNA